MESMTPKVSIMIPIYNSEEYLRRCLDSILEQEYADFELLLIDDGSTDGSPALCDEYQEKDSRVRVIHKENEGVSVARNLAISEARGTWLRFVDSDDWITPESTKLMVRSAEEYGCDMVIADFYRVVGGRLSQKGDIEESGPMTREEFAGYMMKNPANYYYGVLWNKLFRRDIVLEHGLYMNPEISWCEDFMFNLEYLRYAEKICSIHAPVYYYMKRKGSLVTQGFSIPLTIKTKLTVFEYYHDFYKNVLDEEEYQKKRLQVYMYLIGGAADGLVGLPMMPGTKKVGKERASVSDTAIAGDSPLSEQYRNRKLLERYLEIAAIRNDLSVEEASVLLHLRQSAEIISKKELAEVIGIPRRNLTMDLQRLILKGYLRQEELVSEKTEKPRRQEKLEKSVSTEDRERKLRITLLPAADPVLKDLDRVLQDYDEVRFADFDEEELLTYTRLTEKIKKNTQRILSPGAEG